MAKADWLALAATAGKKAIDWAKTEEGREFICGRYSDGTVRSLQDAWNDEIMSPQSRIKRVKQNEKRQKELEEMIFGKPKKKKKKGKKKKKKSSKKKKQDEWMPRF